MQDFKAIPQTGGKYEINSAGQIHGIPFQREFLSPIIFYSEGTIGIWLNRRKTYICGWSIEYGDNANV